ncbi:peptide deformylase [Sulfurovum sp.]|uniref:peptide deformylase n=1 Tax=Sulfurovum sp. TaxID=1969726 RepID=UPI002A35BCE0|nr:peptide deformylase [Sulfurovum sp.]MDD2451899.1 peptide deformylase [Sulfurovum sp.]MDD3500397.1 peptide deformylase [Sulfurovum sp.]MDY0402857.1 peptide deformylase [Sulfurovum sp.]
MIREIVVYPDKRLKLVSREVEEFNSVLHELLDDMYETMVQSSGVGLAAIQVGVDQRVLIINEPDENDTQRKENTLEMINPVIIERSGATKYQEGCLSVPGYYDEVERYKYVKVEYSDRHGQSHTIEDDGFLAIAMQHEMDHLDGKVFVEKLSFTKRKRFEKDWKKRHKAS